MTNQRRPTTKPGAVPIPPPVHGHRPGLVKAFAASLTGTALEWYDFAIYSASAALVFPQVFFPVFGSAHRNPSGVLDVRRRLCGATHWRVRVRPPRRHRGTQETSRHHADVDRFHDLRDRRDPQPRIDRDRRADPPGHHAVRAGRRSWRRVGRRGPAVQRIRQSTTARVLGIGRPDRSACRQPDGQWRAGTADRVDDGSSVRELGLAHRLPGIRRAGRLRVVDPARTRGHPDLQGLAGVG